MMKEDSAGAPSATPIEPLPAAITGAGDRAQALVQATGQITWTTGPDGTFSDAADWCAYTGQSPEEVRDWGGMQAVHPDDRQRVRQAFEDSLATAAPYETEYRIRRFDGEYRWFLARGVPVRDDAGAVREWVGFATDITARRRVDDESAELLERERAARAEAQAATARLRAIQSVTDVILAHLSVDELLPRLLERITEVLTVDNTAILLLAADAQTLTIHMARGPEEEVAGQVRVPLGRGIAGTIAASRKPLIVDDMRQADPVNPFLRERIRSLMGVPLMVEDRVVGVVHVGTTEPRRFTHADLDLLLLVADRIALAITQAQAYEAERVARSQAAVQAHQLEAIFEAVADGMFVFGPAGEVLHANAAARAFFALNATPGFYAAPMHERGYSTTVRDDSDQPLPEEQWPFSRVLRGEVLTGARAVDLMVRTGAGREWELNVSGAPVYDVEGRIVSAVCVVRDVTDRRRLERRTHEALDALLQMAQTVMMSPDEAPGAAQGSPVGQRLVELTQRILSCQRASIVGIDLERGVRRAVAAAGLSPEHEALWYQSVEETPLTSMQEAPDRAILPRLQAGEVLVLDMTRPPWNTVPNRYGIASVLIAPMRVGSSLVGILALDYADPHHVFTPEEIALAGAVAQLAALAIEREQLLHKRAEAQANELALREANRRMDEFLAIASHELKTPLTSLKGFVQLAQRRAARVQAGAAVPVDDVLRALTSVQSVLQRADAQLDRMDRLASDLIDVSRIQAGRLELRIARCDLVAVVCEAVDQQLQVDPTRTIADKIPSGLSVMVDGDADRLAQVVINYLTNALKYSTADKPVLVGLDVGDGAARVWVRDEGPGIPLAEQERIWERFYRAPAIDYRSGSGVGLGMGLHISRSIVERHGGRVGVETNPDGGSTFWFTVPLTGSEAAEDG